MCLKLCVSSRSVNLRKSFGGWFHIITNLQPLITDKGNVFCQIGGAGNSSLNRVLWVRWWGGQIMDLWWRRDRLFVKEAFSCLLLTADREPLGIMEGLPGNGRGREENGFV